MAPRLRILHIKNNSLYLFIWACLTFTPSYGEEETKTTEILPDIVITAQKKEENLLDIPLSVSVYQNKYIQDRKLVDVYDLLLETPNLYLLRPGPYGALINIRGIGGRRPEENSTGVMIDGVHHNNFSALSFLDAERIEVLRGPQGSIYGRNTESGVINVISKRPQFIRSGEASLQIAEYNTQVYSGAYETPLSQDVAMRFAFRQKNSDGYSKNTFLGIDDGEKRQDFKSLFKLLWNPSEDFEALLKLEYDDNHGGFDSINPTFKNISRNTVNDHTGQYDNDAKGIILEINKAYSNFKLSSISSFLDSSDLQNLDLAADPTAGIFYGEFEDSYRDTSQEIRFASLDDEKRKHWIAGLYFLNRDATITNEFNFVGTPLKNVNDLEIQNYAFFGQTTFPIHKKIDLTLGARIEAEKSKFHWQSGGLTTSLNNDFEIFTPKIALAYMPNQESNYFVNVAKGYRSGGYQTNAFSLIPAQSLVRPEKSWVYELGYKAFVLENKLRYSLTLFYTQYDDMQVFFFSPPNVLLRNIGKGRSQGIEFETTYAINKNFTLFAGIGTADAIYKNYNNGLQVLDGNQLPLAPKTSFNLALQYRNEKGWFARADLNGVSSYYLDDQNTVKQDAYETINLKAGIEKLKWSFYLWAENVTDELAYFFLWPDISQNFATTLGLVSDPKILGVEFKLFF